MTAYSELQQEELAQETHGYKATTHQKFVGTGYFDLLAQVGWQARKERAGKGRKGQEGKGRICKSHMMTRLGEKDADICGLDVKLHFVGIGCFHLQAQVHQ